MGHAALSVQSFATFKTEVFFVTSAIIQTDATVFDTNLNVIKHFMLSKTGRMAQPIFVDCMK